MKVELSAWEKAQIEERRLHSNTIKTGRPHFRRVYRNYFRFLNISTDQKGKTITEIGPADFPALYYCQNFGRAYVVEPMPAPILEELISKKKEPVEIVKKCAEEWDFPTVDEIWLLNVLQHVMDPDLIIQKAKEATAVIRFFEPINTPVEEQHLHSFTMEYFQKAFSMEAVKRYVHRPGISNFHTHECAYGVWSKM